MNATTCALGRKYRAPVVATTDSYPTNEWFKIHPRRMKRAREGHGLAAPVVGRPHYDPVAQTRNPLPRNDSTRLADPPTDDTQTPSEKLDGIRNPKTGSSVRRERVLFIFYPCSCSAYDLDELGFFPVVS